LYWSSLQLSQRDWSAIRSSYRSSWCLHWYHKTICVLRSISSPQLESDWLPSYSNDHVSSLSVGKHHSRNVARAQSSL